MQMEEWTRFDPPRSRGIVLHTGVLLFCGAAIALMVSIASQTTPGLGLVLLLVGALLLSLLVPILLYRLYALLQSGYWVGRGGLRLRWGLRQVQLTHEDVLDSALADELETLPPPPRWRWPGSFMGLVEDAELGTVEYMAVQGEGLVLLGTAQRVFVLSPQNPADFLTQYRRQAERGSIGRIQRYSVEPRFVLAEAWGDAPVRRLLLAGGGLAVGLLALTGVLAPRVDAISLGFDASGLPLGAVPAVQLFLLPALNLALFIGSFLLGLILYRESGLSLIARLVWGSSLLSAALFLGAILFAL